MARRRRQTVLVPPKRRSEIRKPGHESSPPTMPPTLKRHPVHLRRTRPHLYAGALSDINSMCSSSHFKAHRRRRPHSHSQPAPLPRNGAASNVADWSKTSFSTRGARHGNGRHPRLDFLTWLWFASEARGGISTPSKHGGIRSSPSKARYCHPRRRRRPRDLPAQRLPPSAPRPRPPCSVARNCAGCQASSSPAPRKLVLVLRLRDRFVFAGLKLPEPKEMLDPASRFQEHRVR